MVSTISVGESYAIAWMQHRRFVAFLFLQVSHDLKIFDSGS